jgi:heat shock protein 5
MGNTINENIGDKLSKEDKYAIQDALDDQQAWLDANPEADTEDYEDHLREVQKVCDPIIGSLYQHMGGQGGHGGDDDEDFDDDL